MKGLGGSGGSWRVLKHPGVSASIMLDPPNRLQKNLAISSLQDRGKIKFRLTPVLKKRNC